MGKMTVYHGSYTTVRQPELRNSRNTKDFGNGFYCTIFRLSSSFYYPHILSEVA